LAKAYRVHGERLRPFRHALVLSQQLDHATRGGDPQQGDGQRHGEEQQHGAVQRQRQQLAAARAEGLAADGLHAERQPREHRVAGDVGEAKRQGAAGQRQLAQAAQEEHGNESPGVHDQARDRHRHRHPADRPSLAGHLQVPSSTCTS